MPTRCGLREARCRLAVRPQVRVFANRLVWIDFVLRSDSSSQAGAQDVSQSQALKEINCDDGTPSMLRQGCIAQKKSAAPCLAILRVSSDRSSANEARARHRLRSPALP
ncbi:hypothetical protein SPHV1_2300058 [Novosphingobium sp. KN65.2]|nr:hypothetical protein SPHV1_2300058 [Novosphingobium sp. KN65.2]